MQFWAFVLPKGQLLIEMIRHELNGVRGSALYSEAYLREMGSNKVISILEGKENHELRGTQEKEKRGICHGDPILTDAPKT